ncbi:MAG: hypothetical protein ABIT01_17080 [Thermoanaerobaculia bacterium]
MLAALVRIPFILLPPLFSDDVYRHRWDGRVLAHGIDPYRNAPSDPALTVYRDGAWAKINHPGVRTVYGPVAQGLLAALALSPAEGSLTSIKALAAAFDLLAVACLSGLGLARGFGRLPALLYALHPLAVLETAGEGHLDGVAVALLLASLLALERGRGRFASLLGAAAGLVKFTPWGAAPALLRSVGKKGALVFVLACVIGFLPFRGSGGPLAGMTVYARSWEGNGALYPEVLRAIVATDLAPRLKSVYSALKNALDHPRAMDFGWPLFDPHLLARVALALLFAGAAVFILRRERDALRASGLLLAALLAVSPTLHPWYLLNVLPFALLFRWTSVVWVAGAAPLFYLSFLPAGAPAFPHPDLIRAIELLPALGLFFLVDARRPRPFREMPA